MDHSIHNTHKEALAVARELRKQGDNAKVLQRMRQFVKDGVIHTEISYAVRIVL